MAYLEIICFSTFGPTQDSLTVHLLTFDLAWDFANRNVIFALTGQFSGIRPVIQLFSLNIFDSIGSYPQAID